MVTNWFALCAALSFFVAALWGAYTGQSPATIGMFTCLGGANVFAGML